MKIAGFTLNNMTMLALVAGDRHRHRRRDRRAREHLPVRRGERRHAEGGRRRSDQGNRPRGDGDDAVAGRHLRAGGLHDRPDRPLLLQLRPDLGGRDPAVDVRVVHADAGALRDVAEAGGRQVGSLDHQVVRLLREDRPRLRQDAGVVAAPSRRDDGHRRRRRAVGRVPLSLRRQGAGAGRRPGRVQHQRPAAARHQLPAHRGVHQADREGRAGAAGAAAGDAERELRLRQLQHHDAAARGAQDLAAAADDPGARRCCASTRARASASPAAPTSRAPRAAAAAAGWRRWRRLQPAQHPDSGAGHRAAPGLHRAADGPGAHDPGRRRRRHQLRADAARAAHQHRSRARGGPRRQHRHAGQQPAHAGRRRGGVGVQGRRRPVQGAAAPRRAVPHDAR